jgi:RimJ/RimL family protein N-acetyltransferase
MKHSIIMEGKSYRLRPVSIEDAQTIIDIRQPSNPRNQYIGRISETPADQAAWIANYYTRKGDYYFLGENKFTEKPECLIRLYDVENGKGEWGSLVTVEGSFAVAEATMLLFDFAFRLINLAEVYCHIIAENTNCINYNDKIGNVRRSLLKDFFELDGKKYDAIDYYITKDHFETVVRPNLKKSVDILYNRNLRNSIKKKVQD